MKFRTPRKKKKRNKKLGILTMPCTLTDEQLQEFKDVFTSCKSSGSIGRFFTALNGTIQYYTIPSRLHESSDKAVGLKLTIKETDHEGKPITYWGGKN